MPIRGITATCRFAITSALALTGLSMHAVAADQITEAQLNFFEQKIRPIFVEHCYSCHEGGSEKKLKGGLDLSTSDGLLHGGESGPAVVLGKPDESLLIESLRYEAYEMPPKGKLPDQVIEDFSKWIAMGMPDPRNETSEAPPDEENPAEQIAADQLWSFQPVNKVDPPQVDGARHPIDRFVRARLLEQNIPSATPARDQVLLRRLYLDVTGLPPTPEDFEAFQSRIIQVPQNGAIGRGDSKQSIEQRENAIEEVVDQLLNSPEFGERWARHWLDLTAYADTIGVGRAIPALEAWRYRDYVIAAFNTDKPYPEFIKQQIAGDIQVPSAPGVPLGPPPTAESIIATGFLAIGPWELVGGNKKQLRMDVIDRQVNRVGKAFLGLTLECARCHSHKFDPISQEDYFALAGIFRSTITLNGRLNGVFSDINQTPLPESADELIARAQRVKAFQADLAGETTKRNRANQKVTQLKKQIAKLKEDGVDKIVLDSNKQVTSQFVAVEKDTDAAAGQDPPRQHDQELKTLEKQLAAAQSLAKKHGDRVRTLNYLEKHRTQSLAYAVKDMPEPEDCHINIRGIAHQLGELVPRGFPVDIEPKKRPAFTRGGSGRVQLANWIADKRNPLTARVWVNRVWHHLFGTGLVRTVDNFGSRGEPSSHPELLDHLASEFVSNDWSTKQLIRRIVLSKTWQQASVNPAAIDAGVNEIDPDNRLLWRANRRRLEAEAIRDSMLAISGQLDRARGGPTLPVDVPGNLNPGSTGILKSDCKFPDDLKFRRTIYLPQKRKGAFDQIDFISAFDLPDSNQETGGRTVTAVPTQALYLANSEFIQQCAKSLALRFADQAAEDRITSIYLRALNRPPKQFEIKHASEFVGQIADGLATDKESQSDDSEMEEEAWARFCQSILMTNEFLFRS